MMVAELLLPRGMYDVLVGKSIMYQLRSQTFRENIMSVLKNKFEETFSQK